MKRTFLRAITLLLVFMCSCSSFLDGRVEFYAGERLTPEAIQSMKDAFTSAENTKKPAVPTQTVAQIAPDATPSLPTPETSEKSPDTSLPATALPETSENFFETVISTPEATFTVPDASDDTTDNVPETTDAADETTGKVSENIRVYWTESGTKYHTHRDCGSLKNSANVKEGSLEQAISEGKESICLKCDKKDNPEKKEE